MLENLQAPKIQISLFSPHMSSPMAIEKIKMLGDIYQGVFMDLK